MPWQTHMRVASSTGISRARKASLRPRDSGGGTADRRLCTPLKHPARGQLFATFQTKEFLVNALTGANRDSVTDTPEYKVTAVRLERVAADGMAKAM
jgi:predicted molibdopterin-dependent oxidoreductase YjgC